MKIGVVRYCLPLTLSRSSSSGGGWILEDILRGLMGKGHEIFILSEVNKKDSLFWNRYKFKFSFYKVPKNLDLLLVIQGPFNVTFCSKNFGPYLKGFNRVLAQYSGPVGLLVWDYELPVFLSSKNKSYLKMCEGLGENFLIRDKKWVVIVSDKELVRKKWSSPFFDFLKEGKIIEGVDFCKLGFSLDKYSAPQMGDLLSYFGSDRKGRLKVFERYYLQSGLLVNLFGNWNKKNLRSLKKYPNLKFKGKLTEREVWDAMRKTFFQIYISDDFYNKKHFITRRFYIGILSGSVVLFQKESTPVSKGWIPKKFIVSSGDEVREFIIKNKDFNKRKILVDELQEIIDTSKIKDHREKTLETIERIVRI